MRGQKIYHWPLDAAAHRALERNFAELTEGAAGDNETLAVLGRELAAPRVAGDVAWFHFDELCARPLAAPDYLASPSASGDRPRSHSAAGPPAAQRGAAFHILIDTLYEARALFVASAEVPPEQIYVEGDGSFEFQRTVSRLMEMQSEDYVANRRPPNGG